MFCLDTEEEREAMRLMRLDRARQASRQARKRFSPEALEAGQAAPVLSRLRSCA